MPTRARLLPLLLLLLLPEMAAASPMRCGNRLIDEGDSQAWVLSLCGEPMARELLTQESYIIETGYGAVVRNVVHEVWTYNLGPSYFIRLLHFRNSVLQRIELGDKP